MISKLALTLGN